jgi:peptide/nickel transport system substrate-binding protein
MLTFARDGVPLLLLALCVTLSPARAAEEPPFLAQAVAEGRLPPLAERLPAVPRRDLPAGPGWRSGRYGGELRMLERGGRDARALVVFGYARLLVWQRDAPNSQGGRTRLVPDILERVEVVDGRVFTLQLRRGHRWSDGAPFTAEDFRFWWEDVANDAALSPAGPPQELLVAGRPARFELLDETSVRFSWDRPNARFLPALAATSPLFIYRPAHHLKAFHARYADEARLNEQARALGLGDWAGLYLRRDEPFRFDNPALPTLQPWVNRSAPPAERFTGERNPYFHRVDAEGRQLPYIDRVILDRTQAQLIPVRAAVGESDLQAVGLTLRDFTVLKQAETQGRIKVALWPIGRGAQLALYPNLNAADPVLRALLREADFRRALSLEIDRDEINKVLYGGLAEPGNNALLPDSPLHRPALRRAWAQHDPARAGKLLDKLGLGERDSAGYRLRPDGQRLAMVAEAGDSDPAEIDVLQLIADDWRAIGVELLIHSTSRQAFRASIRSGRVPISIFYGLANGIATADMSPAELVPTDDRQNNWPLWGLHYRSGGQSGEAPDLPEALRLLELYEAWSRAPDEAARRAAWEEMLVINADQVFTIGLVGGVLQPVAYNARLRNLPERAVYLYDPGAYFGIYRPDTFWFEE